MAEPQDAPPLTPEDSARLVEFARGCKAALRAVVLYPAGHPAIAATLGRIVHLTAPPQLAEPMRLTVLPDALRLDHRASGRPDAAIGELASHLHAHLIGEVVVRPGGDVEAWRQFLLLLGRSPDAVRAEGGIARVWATLAGRHIELREIDYAEALRDRAGAASAVWEAVIASSLQGDRFELDEAAVEELLATIGDPDRLRELMQTLEARAGNVGPSAKVAALLRMLRGIVEMVRARRPDALEPALGHMAAAVGQLSPDLLLGLLAHLRSARDGDAPSVMNAVVSRMTAPTVASFVARSVAAGDTPMDRLALAFQTLVPADEQRERVLALAHEELSGSPLGSTDGFETAWSDVAQKLLTSYSDTSFVSDAYGRELTQARTQAIEVEQISDDPPERIGAWVGTVATSALRSLDLMLLVDLLRLESDEARWGQLLSPVVALLEDLLLVGDFEAAVQLVEVLAAEAREAGSDPGELRRGKGVHAARAMERLVAGSLMRHLSSHLAVVDDVQFERVKRLCGLVGEPLVRPLAEALAAEDRARPRERLTAILLSFGNVARRTVEKLKASTNPAVRRTAIHLMREFGGSEALPDLTELLDDDEPQVQREAVRAILNIGSETAYRVLEQALSSGTARTRDAIMQSLSVLRDERAAPLLAYILRHVSHRGPLAGVYVRAIESLGALRDPEAIAPLSEALYKGEWWAPKRTRAIRQAAASALARIATPEALAALSDAAASGPSGVRAAARASLSAAEKRSGRRPEAT